MANTTKDPAQYSAFIQRLRDGVKDVAAGTIAGMAAKTIEYPFDTLKTRLQTSSSYAGPIDCLKQMVATDGWAMLYRGIAAPLYGAMVENALMFYAYGEAKRMLAHTPDGVITAPDSSRMPLLQIAMAGAFSGVVVSAWMTPMELVKCRMQAGHTTTAYRNTAHCISTTWRKEGLRGFYRGYLGTLIREMPGNACYFTMYETIARLLTPHDETRATVSPARLMIAGSCSGIAYWTPCFPADVIKSRMQTDIGQANQKTFLQTFWSIMAESGVRGLYRGLGVTLVRAVPANAVIFYFYESSIRLLNAHDF